MRKQTCISIVFGIASHEKSKFLKKVHVRESHEFPGRMRVAAGSPKKKENKQNTNSVRKSSNKKVGKKEGKLGEKPYQNWCPNHDTSILKSFTKVDSKKIEKNENKGTTVSRRP